MRPTTGLKDMFFELDPGSAGAGEYEEGETVPVANTAPDVNLDEILAALDSDTQAYLRLLLVGAGKGLDGPRQELGKLLGGLGPINRDLAELNSEVAKRKENLARLVHNFNLLTDDASASADDDLTELVSASNARARRDRRAGPERPARGRLLPGTLDAGDRDARPRPPSFAAVLGPAFDDLRPFARNLDELNASTRAAGRVGDAGARATRSARSCARRGKPVPDLRTRRRALLGGDARA